MDIQVGFLIGRNCPRAMESIDVIPSEGEGPYAYGTQLGWCIGRMDYTSTMKVNNTQVRWPAKDICTGIRTANQFQPNNFIRDQGVDEFWKEVCKTDIVESNREEVALSKEERVYEHNER